MFNPYSIILGLFTAAGIITTLWGWSVIVKARKSASWPSVAGKIVRSETEAENDNMLPDIRFSYTIDGKDYQKLIEFPASTTPTQEFSKDYTKRFPQGADVKVFYNPDNHQQAILEPGQQPGDWMILAFGLGTVALMLVVLLMGD